MKDIFLFLGNGFTIDFINYYNFCCSQNKKKKVSIDVSNLFRYGEVIEIPWERRPGFLSYKICPALWTLGARCSLSIEESNSLIEEIISCANMFFDFINNPDLKEKERRLSMVNDNEKRIHLRAYNELIVYLRLLFSWYNTLISDSDIDNFIEFNSQADNHNKWGWLEFLQKIDKEKITFVSYNYDIWLERLLQRLGKKFKVYGINCKENAGENTEKNTDKDTDENIEIIKPHGSISFVPKNFTKQYEISYKFDVDGIACSSLKLEYDSLGEYLTGAIIPPAGDSSRLETTTSWAKEIRTHAVEKAKTLADSESSVVICGLSYWHVDRKEIDELLINFSPFTELTFINPFPPRDLNAVLASIFDNYILQSSSERIGRIIYG